MRNILVVGCASERVREESWLVEHRLGCVAALPGPSSWANVHLFACAMRVPGRDRAIGDCAVGSLARCLFGLSVIMVEQWNGPLSVTLSLQSKLAHYKRTMASEQIMTRHSNNRYPIDLDGASRYPIPTDRSSE